MHLWEFIQEQEEEISKLASKHDVTLKKLKETEGNVFYLQQTLQVQQIALIVYNAHIFVSLVAWRQ